MPSFHSEAEGLPDADSILKKSFSAGRGTREESLWVMQSTEDGNKETPRKMKVWYKGSSNDDFKLLVKFTEPAKYRGSGFLSIYDKTKGLSQWIYDPERKKTRRVVSGSASESFLDSEFTVGDLNGDLSKQYGFTVKGVEKCGAVECFRLEGEPKAESAEDAVYSKQVLLVRKDNYLTVKAEFFDRSGKLYKHLVLDDLKKLGEVWTASTVTMKNEKTGRKSVISYEKRDFSKSPSDSLFTEANLER